MRVDFQEAQEEAQTQIEVYTDQIEVRRRDLILPKSNIIFYWDAQCAASLIR